VWRSYVFSSRIKTLKPKDAKTQSNRKHAFAPLRLCVKTEHILALADLRIATRSGTLRGGAGQTRAAAD
jgi:hypothetical protein